MPFRVADHSIQRRQIPGRLSGSHAGGKQKQHDARQATRQEFSCGKKAKMMHHVNRSEETLNILLSASSAGNGSSLLVRVGTSLAMAMNRFYNAMPPCVAFDCGAGDAGLASLDYRGCMKVSYFAVLALALVVTTTPDLQAQKIKVIVDQDARGPATTDMQSIL